MEARRIKICAIFSMMLFASLIVFAQTANALEATVEYDEGEAVKQEIVQDGVTWTLVSTKNVAGTETEARHFEQSKQMSVSASEWNGNAASYFPESIRIEEDGYAGDIPQTATSFEISSYAESQPAGEIRKSFENYTQADIATLPDTIESNGVTYIRVSIDANRMPSSAKVELYSGTAAYSCDAVEEPETYSLTATYSGDLSKTGAGGHIEAVYKSEPAVSDATSPTDSTAEISTDDATPTTRGESSNAVLIAFVTILALTTIALSAYIGRHLFLERKKREQEALYEEPEVLEPEFVPLGEETDQTQRRGYGWKFYNEEGFYDDHQG